MARSASSSESSATALERSRLGCVAAHVPTASLSRATDLDFIAESTASSALHRSSVDSASATASSSCHGHALVLALATAFSSLGTSPGSRDPGEMSRPRSEGSKASAKGGPRALHLLERRRPAKTPGHERVELRRALLGQRGFALGHLGGA